MKKYHLVRLYQAHKSNGYIENGKKYGELYFMKEGTKWIGVLYSFTYTERVIMVEKISPSLVKEVKTGIIFPIVNIKNKKNKEGNSEYTYCPFNKVHTFVCSKENKLLSKEVTSSTQLEEYDRLHPDAKKFKEELLEIIREGKVFFDAKIAEEKRAKEQEDQKKKEEKESKRNERLKVRRLKIEFKRGRK